MHAIHHILVAIKDPRAKSHPAVTKAAAIATALDAKLQLFHAIDIPVYPDLGVVDGLPLPEDRAPAAGCLSAATGRDCGTIAAPGSFGNDGRGMGLPTT